MTTTAATTSASPSTSSDSPIQDNDGASEPTNEQQQLLNQHQQSSKQPQNNNNNSNSNSNTQQANNSSNNNEQKRPMNAFLLFCKRQRSLVREKNPHMENRGITKILGEYWSKLNKEQKSKYTELARQHKEAFMKANPDFKWCKTPMSNNVNNNNHPTHTHIHHNRSSNTSNSNSSDCYTGSSITNNNIDHRHITESSLPPTHLDVIQSNINLNISELNNINSRETLTNNRQPQHEAPKPPKKRFLERNDSIYTKKDMISNNEPTSHAKEGVVPYISLDKETLDRVINEAFPEKSNNNPSGLNMCKCSNRISNTNNLTSTSSLGVNPTSFSSPSNILSSSSSSTTMTTTTTLSSYSAGVDEPVDFSMNRTINATRQQIINNLVEKMLSEPTDNHACSTSRINGTDSVPNQPGLPMKRDNPDDT